MLSELFYFMFIIRYYYFDFLIIIYLDISTLLRGAQ